MTHFLALKKIGAPADALPAALWLEWDRTRRGAGRG
jgi:hypothetical protein